MTVMAGSDERHSVTTGRHDGHLLHRGRLHRRSEVRSLGRFAVICLVVTVVGCGGLTSSSGNCASQGPAEACGYWLGEGIDLKVSGFEPGSDFFLTSWDSEKQTFTVEGDGAVYGISVWQPKDRLTAQFSFVGTTADGDTFGGELTAKGPG